METDIKELSSQYKLSGIGIMSGTSTDGIDLTAVTFNTKDEKSSYELKHTKFVAYSQDLIHRLLHADKINGRDLKKLDTELALLIAEEVNVFMSETSFKPDFIASHGHTVFHEPDLGYTLQIGSGAIIASKTGITTVSDFRQGDISLGGQGAPLVPIGDLHLFNEYNYCLNLGGFANISFKNDQSIEAFDVCALNVVMNKLAQKKGLAYDEGGKIAENGNLKLDLFDELQELSFYKLKAPKSLGTEWVEKYITPIIEKYLENYSIADIMHTYAEHAAYQIAKCMNTPNSFCLVSGGGCKNTYLMKSIALKADKTQLDYSNKEIVDFKEALIFAFLGYLRVLEKPNVLKEVSGATEAASAGAIYLA
jgi:anhydro-N-acetylmuramic acid kinase